MNEFFKIYIPGSGYAVTPNRRLQVQAGGKSVRTTVELNGLSGKGVGVNDAAKYVGDPSVDEAYKSLKMKSGIFATDVNNRESITNLVKSQAYYRMALEHLRAAGVPDAQEELERFYFLQNLNSRSLVDSILPGGRIVVENPYAEYEKEVREFEPYYNIGRLGAAFIKAISELTNGDASSYGNLYFVGRDFFEDMTLNFENFEEKLRKVEWQGADVENIISKMKASLGSNYKYAPRDGASYFAAFVDYPEHVHQLAYQWALKTAEAQLKAKKPSEGFDISKIFTPDDIWIEPC
jgi:hypothetical protein